MDHQNYKESLPLNDTDQHKLSKEYPQKHNYEKTLQPWKIRILLSNKENKMFIGN